MSTIAVRGRHGRVRVGVAPLLLLMVWFVATAGAHAQWSSQLIINPRPSPFVSDWQTAPGQGELILTHVTGPATQIRFRFNLERDGSQVAAGTSSPTSFPGSPATQSFRTHTAVDWGNLKYSGNLTTQIRATGRLPEGRYRACIATLDVQGNVLTEACASFVIDELRSPRLISPRNGDTVPTNLPLLTWNGGGMPRIDSREQFRLVIVEVPKGRSPEQSIVSGRPLYDELVSTQSLIYPPTALPLESGKSYAWRITLARDGKPLPDRNANSETWRFTISPNATIGAPRDAKGPKTIADGNGKIPKSIISGQLLWRFPKGPGGGKLKAFANDHLHPIINGKVKIVAPLPASLNRGAYTVIATGTTDAEGNFSLAFTDPSKTGKLQVTVGGKTISFTEVQVLVDNPRFSFPKTSVTLKKEEPGSWSLGTIEGTALQYEFNPVVKTKDGKTPTDVTIEVFRPAHTYKTEPSIEPEGTLAQSNRETETLSSHTDGVPWKATFVKISEGSPSTRFVHLFSSQGEKDLYRVRVTAPGYVTWEGNLQVAPNRSGPDGWPVYTKTIVLMAGMPAVSGRVLYTDGMAVQGAMVSLRKKGEKAPAPPRGMGLKMGGEPTLAVMTDEHGRFTIANVPPLNEPYVLWVRGSGFADHSEQIVLNKNGMNVKRDPIKVDGIQITVIGRVVDDHGKGIGGAQVRWGEKGEPVTTTSAGGFIITTFAGPNTLVISKVGFADLKRNVIVKDGTFNFLGKDVEHAWSAGTMEMTPRVGRLLATVIDSKTKSPIQGASIFLGDTLPSGTTGSDGRLYVPKAPAGDVTVRVNGPDGTDYVPYVSETVISDKGDTTNVTISLKMGTHVTGRVTADGKGLAGGRVRVDGRDDITTTTTNDGGYMLRGVPVGEYALKATAQGYVGAQEARTFTTNPMTIDFVLTSGGGLDISSLLGFPIEVDELKIAGKDTMLTGSFVDIPSNGLFSTPQGLRIPFTNARVRTTAKGTVPVGDTVKTDITELSGVAFKYLVVSMKSPSGVVVRTRNNDATSGRIAGRIVIDFGKTFTQLTGWKWSGQAVETIIQPYTAEFPKTPEWMTLYTNDGSLPLPAIDSIRLGSAGKRTLTVYGVDLDIDFAHSSVKADGLHLRGKVGLPQIPVVNVKDLMVDHLWIGVDGKVKEAEVGLNPKPTIDIAGWKLGLQSIAFGETGFKLDGEVEIEIPATPKSKLQFKNLQIGGKQVFGGTFIVPKEGINLFSVVKFEGDAKKPLTFGQVGGTNVYRVTGAGVFSLPKYIEKKLTLTEFEVRTDGKVKATAATNIKASILGIAELSITEVGIDATGKKPQVKIGGGITLKAIPYVTPKASGIRYMVGGKISVDTIALDFELKSIAKVGVMVALMDNGFVGKGSIAVGKTPIGGGIEFHYLKKNGGVDFGAGFVASFPPIPVGTVTINKVGGGFNFNTGTKKYKVWVTGAASVAPGTDGVLSLDPIEVSIESGPIVKGFVQANLIGQKIADAKLVIDFPQKYFDIECKVAPEFLKYLQCDVKAGVKLVVSGSAKDPYYFLGTYVKAKILGLIDGNVNLAVGMNAPAKKFPDYTDFIPNNYKDGDGRIFGAHLESHIFIGRRKSDAWMMGWGNTHASFWAYYDSWMTLHADYRKMMFGVGLGTAWGAGGEVKFLGVNIVKADVSMSSSLSGSFSPQYGWYLDGSLKATLLATFGACAFNDCTPFRPCALGARVCVHPTIGLSYKTIRNPRWDFNVGW